jgi:hypothetical protein
MRRASSFAVLLSIGLTTPGDAQTLRDRFTRLFTFGDCGQPLCLSVNAAVHGDHYIPAATQGEANLLAFITDAIGLSLGNIPSAAATSGVTFRFEGGAPVATSVSAGPIYGERAQTLGRGRLLIGANVSGIAFDNIRGVRLDRLKSYFAHQNVGDPVYGDPVLENDYVEVTTDLDVHLVVTNLYASFGLTDWIDLAVALPVVSASLRGSSRATVVPFTQPSPHGFGSDENPSLSAAASARGSSVGPGDLSARIKLHLFQSAETGFAVIADARFPTGDTDEFHGAGETTLRVLGAYGAAYGGFSPHLNAGVLFQGSDTNDRLLAAIGFDQLVGPRVTLAGSILTNFELGESRLRLPEPVIYTAPAVRILELTDIPDKSDHFVDASLGMKVAMAGGMRIVSNVLVPLVDGGMRPRFLWTLGLERTF